nr:radical SAM protein [Actinoplanes philippinensis]
MKVASRCNLACTYCYMYEMTDQSWVDQPRFISADTAHALGKRLATYAVKRELSSLTVVAHGGEPLLMGVGRLRDFLAVIDDSLRRSGCFLRLGVQTNGTLINGEFIELFQEYNVGVGVSLDGPAQAHDRHRVDKYGIGSSRATIAGLSRLHDATQEEGILGGLLSYAHIDILPAEFLAFFAGLGVANLDVLLPDFNHDTIPPNYRGGAVAQWMIELFDLWIDRPDELEIRTFAVIMHLLLGGRFGYESFGANSLGVLVVETDGGYHASDTLKSAYEGVTSTGLNVWHHEVREAEESPLLRAAIDKAASAAAECLSCPIFNVCGGGLLAHRYSARRGFNQPSVYCEDIKAVVGHIRRRLAREIPAQMLH